MTTELEPSDEQLAAIALENEDEEEYQHGYKPPAQKSLQEIQELDQDDESLRKYKEALLGNTAVAKDPSVPNVQVTRMSLVCDTATKPLVLPLDGDLKKLKDHPFVLKEGVPYKIQITFKVNKDIVAGLKYMHVVSRKGIPVEKTNCMVGSYGPKPEEYQYLTPVEEAPKGVIARGTYNIKSKFTDDDKANHLSWEWALTIKKDWD